MTPPRVRPGATPIERWDDATFRLFISFAAVNNSSADGAERKVSRFVRDLSWRIKELTALGDHEMDTFFSDETIRVGDDWEDRIDHALNRADVFVPIMSPAFFRSDWCAREWGAFEARVASTGDRGIDAVIPIIWIPEELPVVARRRHIEIDKKIPQYREHGLQRLQGKARETLYEEVIDLIAHRLKSFVEDSRRPKALDVPINVGTAPQAFPVRLGMSPCASWRYSLLHAAVSEPGLSALEKNTPLGVVERDPRHYYSDTPRRWDPFRDEDGDKKSSQVSRAIKDEMWRLRMKPVRGAAELTLDVGVSSHLPDPGRADAEGVVLVVSLDAWLAQYPRWRGKAREALLEILGKDFKVMVVSPHPNDSQYSGARRDVERKVRGQFGTPGGTESGGHREKIVLDFPDSCGKLIEILRRGIPEVCGRGANGAGRSTPPADRGRKPGMSSPIGFASET